MPGGGGGRKKPFSGKQKKAQLQAKKQKESFLRREDDEGEARIVSKSHPAASSLSGPSGSKFFETRPAPNRSNPGRYALMFRAETKEDVQRLKEEAMKTVYPVEEQYLECKSEDFYTPLLDFPIRPSWNYELSLDELERNENRYFQDYLKRIDEKFEANELSYFELNLETWRQLWRVLEMSDIVLCIVDIRFPPLLFPPRLYEYVRQVGKHIIVVLNKVDVCPAPLVLAWKDYFIKKYEGLQVICFTSYPSYNLHGNLASTGLNKGRRVRGKLHMAAEGAMEVFKACEEYAHGQVDLTQWKQKIMEEMSITDSAGGKDEDTEDIQIENFESIDKQDTGFYEFKKFNSGILTIGCVGQPNVGKSSLINALMGKKVVSVSKTPGHTKHFQTIFLTPNVRLCDCPGLIFPSKVPKPLQVLSGSYPIAQLREPYSTVKYLAERLDLPKILAIQHPEGNGETQWSAFDIVDGWALKRGYYTAKASRLDSYRAANHMLRLALDGRICLCLSPPGYTAEKGAYIKDPRVAEILSIQAKTNNMHEDKPYNIELSESDDEDTEADGGVIDKSNAEQNSASDNPAESISDSEDRVKIYPNQRPGQEKPKMQNKFAVLMAEDRSSSEDDS